MATIKDVAKACGVSTATVSYVLNGKNRLPQSTRDRVMHTVRALNYHPSAVARGLSHKRLNTVGILFGVVDSVAIITHPYTSHILQGVITVASETGNNVTFYTRPWRTASRSAAAYRDRRADGLIVVAPPLDADIIPGLSKIDMPMVAISFPGRQYGITSVDMDNAAAVRLAFEHLRALGHTQIAHLSGPANTQSGAEREQTFRSLMQESGLEMPEEFAGPHSYDRAAAYRQTRRLLLLPKPPTAIIAGNDDTALSAMNAARDLGVSVPIRLSVVGIDDTQAGAMNAPPLTSVYQPLNEIGELAMRLLIGQIEGAETTPSEHLLAPKLIVRASTAPPVF